MKEGGVMKSKIFLILVLLLSSQYVFSETKVGEPVETDLDFAMNMVIRMDVLGLDDDFLDKLVASRAWPEIVVISRSRVDRLNFKERQALCFFSYRREYLLNNSSGFFADEVYGFLDENIRYLIQDIGRLRLTPKSDPCGLALELRRNGLGVPENYGNEAFPYGK